MAVLVERRSNEKAEFRFTEPVVLNDLPTAEKVHTFSKLFFSTQGPLKKEFRELSHKVEIMSNEEIINFLSEEVPELSGILGRPATQMDVIFLYTELLKLMIEGKSQEKLSRRDERILQLDHIQEVVENYKSTAKSLHTAGLISGIMGIASGVAPMFGFTKFGKSMLDGMSNAFDTFKGLEPEDAFSKLGKVLSSMSQMNREMGEVRKTNAEAHRYEDQQR